MEKGKDQKASLSRFAFSSLEAMILKGTFAFNVPILENEIAKLLGISRTPIREALFKLEEQGFVRKISSARFVVPLLDFQEVLDSIDFLNIMEVEMFKQIQSDISESDIELALRCANQMISFGNAAQRDSWEKSDRDFHALFSRVCRNKLIANATAITRKRIHFYIRRTHAQTNRLLTCAEEHLELVNAVKAKNNATIASVLNLHFQHMREGLRQSDLASESA
jgi:DNA-binding GntR family transcriptional regulator